MLSGTVREELKLTSSIRIESCEHKQHSLYAVKSYLIFTVDSAR